MSEQHFNDDISIQIDNMDLSKEPPKEESLRQYWFIKKAREKVREISARIGRPLYACTVNMGCQVNIEREISKSR